MSSFVEVIKQASEALAHGQILIQDLQKILGKVDHFKSVVAEIKDNPIRPDYLIATLALREKELYGYQTTLKIVQDFVYMCTRFKGKVINVKLFTNNLNSEVGPGFMFFK